MALKKGRILVRFLVKHAGYNAGQKAGFADKKALEIIETKTADGSPVAEFGDEKVGEEYAATRHAVKAAEAKKAQKLAADRKAGLKSKGNKPKTKVKGQDDPEAKEAANDMMGGK